jgi:hypothetical protein
MRSSKATRIKSKQDDMETKVNRVRKLEIRESGFIKISNALRHLEAINNKRKGIPTKPCGGVFLGKLPSSFATSAYEVKKYRRGLKSSTLQIDPSLASTTSGCWWRSGLIDVHTPGAR